MFPFIFILKNVTNVHLDIYVERNYDLYILSIYILENVINIYIFKLIVLIYGQRRLDTRGA